MQAEERFHARIVLLLAALDEPSVLREAFLRDARAVAVGQLIAEAGTQAGFAHSPLNRTQRTDDRLRTGMMINQRRRAVVDRTEQRNQRAVVAVLHGQRGIQPPPKILEHFVEIFRGLRLGQTAREAAVEMRVGIDKAGQNDLARCINAFVAEVFDSLLWRDPRNETILDQNGVAEKNLGRLDRKS